MYASKKTAELIVDGNPFGYVLLFMLLSAVFGIFACITLNPYNHTSWINTLSGGLLVCSAGCLVMVPITTVWALWKSYSQFHKSNSTARDLLEAGAKFQRERTDLPSCSKKETEAKTDV